MIKKTFSLFICGMTLVVSAQGQMRNNQGQLIPGREPQVFPPATILRPQENKADRIRRMSQYLAQQLDLKAGLLSVREQSEVFELLRRARDIVTSGGDNEGSQLISSNAFAVSRKTGGEWITLKYDQPVDVAQLNLRGIGSGAIKIYGINFITSSGQNHAIQTPTLDLTGNTTLPIYSEIQEKVTYLQILAEAFRSSMSLGIDCFGAGHDDGNVVGPQQPHGPKCEMYGSGGYTGYSYLYRGGYNGEAKFGTDNFEQMITKISQFEQAGLCGQYMDKACTLAGSGSLAGYSYKYRVKIGDTLVIGTDNTTDLFSKIGALTANRMCGRAIEKCDLLSAGGFAGYSYNQRVSVGSTVVYGADSQDDAIKFISQLRLSGLCQ